MKHIKFIATLLLLASTMPVLQSCLNDDNDDNNYNMQIPSALVTVKNEEGKLMLQLDDSTKLYPSNITKPPYGDKEVRALVNYNKVNSSNVNSVYVNWIDSIRTKNMAADLGTNNDTKYGTDPLEIVKDWVTVVEDGYLTLRFRTYFGYNITHELNLVKGSSPYEVVLHHNANGDKSGILKDGLIAFKLDSLPDTEGKTVDLTVKWNSFSGEKTATFKYRSRSTSK
ncbi:NigD1/NigD2 family lipoprotein [Segatella paludivivens]|uniref:NigD-like protein n=1 Tax=Segatella paludivivens TaxID=185294 RepID=UPI0003A2AA2F|nr:NigD-like protein [Segatella paludivivens]